MAVTVLAVGKKHEDWVKLGVERYQERLRAPYLLQWELIPHSQYDGDRARQEESERILSRIPEGSFVILLDERGENIDSPTLSSLLEREFTFGRKPVVVIGGAYGVDVSVHKKADFVWSLSKLVFPHQLVRLITAEQVYRAQQIAQGSSYHHQ